MKLSFSEIEIASCKKYLHKKEIHKESLFSFLLKLLTFPIHTYIQHPEDSTRVLLDEIEGMKILTAREGNTFTNHRAGQGNEARNVKRNKLTCFYSLRKNFKHRMLIDLVILIMIPLQLPCNFLIFSILLFSIS